MTRKRASSKTRTVKTRTVKTRTVFLGLSDNKHGLSLEGVRAVAIGEAKVALHPGALKRIIESRSFLEEEVRAEKVMYGVNTGFGVLSSVRIAQKDIAELQMNIVRSHATGVGPLVSDTVSRAMLLLRAQSLALGFSGVRVELIEQLIALINRGVCPCIPEQGSVGASGDLAPLAHLALVLIGEGRARYKGEILSGRAALRKIGLRPLRLTMKEGLSLINGTQFMTAIGTLALLDAEHLADFADAASAMSLEAVRGTAAAFDSKIQALRPHPGQVAVARHMRELLGPRPSAIAKSHADCDRVQDPYSFRCIPQVHGASRDLLSFARSVLEREVRSVTDNPLVFSREREILSGGNFHGEIVAFACDALAIAMAEIANISEQRIQKLMNQSMSGLPTFLTKKGGLHSGFMMVQVAAASIVSENKTLCHPASVDSIPTNVDKEDHVSMGAWAARKAEKVVTNVRRVLAMELMAAAQGIDLLRPLKTTDRLEQIHRRLRKEVKVLKDDRELAPDLERIERMIEARVFI